MQDQAIEQTAKPTETDPVNLKKEITTIAREMGIDKIGFTTRERLADAPPSADLSYVLPEARSAVSLLIAFDKPAIRAYLAKNLDQSLLITRFSTGHYLVPITLADRLYLLMYP